MNAIVIDVGELSSDDQIFVALEIGKMTENHAPELVDCYDIIALGRKDLIKKLKESGNKKMLKRVRSKRREYYLLMLYRKTMKLRVVPLPYEVNSDEAEQASQ